MSQVAGRITGTGAAVDATTCEEHRISLLDHSTRSFVRWLTSDPPVEVIKDVVTHQMHSNKDKSLISSVLSIERPFIAVSVVSFLLAFVSLVAGITIIYRNVVQVPTKKSAGPDACGFTIDKCVYVYLGLAVTLSFLLLITDVALFRANNHISESFPTARKTLTKLLDDLHHYQSHTLQELDQILRSDFESAVKESMTELRVLTDCSSLRESSNQEPVKFQVALKSAASTLKDTKEMLSEVKSTLDELKALFRRLKAELVKMDMFYKEAQRFCLGSKNIEDDEDLCKMFVGEREVFSDAKPPQVPKNLSQVISKVDLFLEELHSTPIYKFVKSKRSNKRRLCQERAGKLKELERICDGIRFGRDLVLKTVTKYSNELTNKTLLPARNKVNTLLSEDGVIVRYDRYRWWAAFLMSLALLFAVLSAISSVVVKGAEPFIVKWISIFTQFRIPTLTSVSRPLMLSSLGLHVGLAVFINIFAGLVFMVMSNMAMVCDISNDYDKLDHLIGTPSLLKESKLFNGNGPVHFIKTISKCPKDGTLWSLLNMDKKFNINKSVAQVDKIPVVSQYLFQDNSDDNEKKRAQKIAKLLKQWSKLGLRDIDVKLLYYQVDSPFVDQSFRNLSSSLTTSLDNLDRNVTNPPFKMFQSVANQALVIEDNYLKMYSALSKRLAKHLRRFEKLRKMSMLLFTNITHIYSDFLDEDEINKNHDHHIVKVIDAIDSFLRNDFHKVQSDVGQCEPIKKVYNDTVCCFCTDIFGPWNRWWILLVTCSFLVMLSLLVSALILWKTSGSKN